MPVLAGQTGVSAWRGHTVSDRFDSIEESERVWLDAKRRSAARRSWLLIGALVLVAVFLAWLTVDGLADGQPALTDWGRFAVSNDLRVLKDSFWANGPQYKLLAKEAQSRDQPIGGPAYKVTMTGVQVISARSDQRVLRGRVLLTRPGEVAQTFAWDIWMRRDDAAGGRWRLWTVRETAAR